MVFFAKKLTIRQNIFASYCASHVITPAGWNSLQVIKSRLLSFSDSTLNNSANKVLHSIAIVNIACRTSGTRLSLTAEWFDFKTILPLEPPFRA